jgi:DNA-directed RNA polymerase subunit RPC12/RpoP
MADFISKIKEGFGKGVTTASVKSSEMLDSSRCKGQIDTLTKQKMESLEELGNIVFNMFKKGEFNEEFLKSKCSTIANIDQQIKAKEEELLEIHLRANEALGKPRPVGLCNCGAEIFENTKFCGTCGSPVVKRPPKSEPGSLSRKCGQCNSPLEVEDKFCNACGAKVELATENESSGQTNRCPSCGNEVGSGVKFCGKCGTKLG